MVARIVAWLFRLFGGMEQRNADLAADLKASKVIIESEAEPSGDDVTGKALDDGRF